MSCSSTYSLTACYFFWGIELLVLSIISVPSSVSLLLLKIPQQTLFTSKHVLINSLYKSLQALNSSSFTPSSPRTGKVKSAKTCLKKLKSPCRSPVFFPSMIKTLVNVSSLYLIRDNTWCIKSSFLSCEFGIKTFNGEPSYISASISTVGMHLRYTNLSMSPDASEIIVLPLLQNSKAVGSSTLFTKLLSLNKQ